MSEHQSAPDPYGALAQPEGTEPPAPVSEQEPHAPPSSPEGQPNNPDPYRRRGRVASTTAVLALVLSLAGWGWFASENARELWWPAGQHVAVEPDEAGWATVDTVSVRLTDAQRVSAVDGNQPPGGFEYLAVDFEVVATDTESYRSCEVEVRDAQDRLFLAGREVPNGDPYSSSLTCGTSDPADDPVPENQSVLVLVPVDAELESVRVVSREFPPATFVDFPLPL